MRVPCTMGYTATAIAIMLYQVNKHLEEKKITIAALSKMCKVERTTISFILQNRSKGNLDAPDRSHRLLSVLKIRKSLGIPTIIESTDGSLQLDLNNEETYAWLAKDIHQFLLDSKEKTSVLERAAKVHRGQVHMFAKDPDKYLTLRATLNGYNYWMKEISFVF